MKQVVVDDGNLKWNLDCSKAITSSAVITAFITTFSLSPHEVKYFVLSSWRWHINVGYYYYDCCCCFCDCNIEFRVFHSECEREMFYGELFQFQRKWEKFHSGPLFWGRSLFLQTFGFYELYLLIVTVSAAQVTKFSKFHLLERTMAETQKQPNPEIFNYFCYFSVFLFILLMLQRFIAGKEDIKSSVSTICLVCRMKFASRRECVGVFSCVSVRKYGIQRKSRPIEFIPATYLIICIHFAVVVAKRTEKLGTHKVRRYTQHTVHTKSTSFFERARALVCELRNILTLSHLAENLCAHFIKFLQ